MTEQRYVVATIRPWNIVQYRATISKLPGKWHLITKPEQLTLARLSKFRPRFIFFPHWSYAVPKQIVERFECVCFHETDVPYGRGGSPIQNLIERGHKKTFVTALRMVEEMDAGPIYARRPLSLTGLAEEIYIRAAGIVSEMIEDIAMKKPHPVPQKGRSIVFKRRSPKQSKIPSAARSLADLYDHIRMLDADEYPHAYLEHGGLRFEFTRPALRTGRIEANVSITPVSKRGEKR